MAPKYNLIYFNGRGRGEVIRLIFETAGQAYTDTRIERADWPSHKAGTPFGQLPVLEVDGVKLCQSNACARYVARAFKLAGKTDLEQAQADMVVDCFEDSIKPILTFFFEKDEAKKAEQKKKFLEEQLPSSLALLESLLKTNHGGDKFWVGTELTWADLSFLIFAGWLKMAGAENPLAKYPKLQALHSKVEKVPAIAAWIAKRPQTEF